MPTPSSPLETLWALRDARGLSTIEKAITAMVISRGTAYASAETLMADACVGRTAFYAARKRLTSLGVLHAVERPGQTTVYTVDAAALIALAPLPRRESGHKVGVPPHDTGTPAASRQGGMPPNDIQSVNQKRNFEDTSSSAAIDSVPTGLDVDFPRPQHGMTSTHSIDVQALALAAGMTLTATEKTQIDSALTGALSAGLTPLGASTALVGYLQRRALPATEPGHARSVAVLRLMLQDAATGTPSWSPRTAQPQPPANVATASHTMGGRRVSTM